MTHSVWEQLESFVRKEAGLAAGQSLNRALGLEIDLDVTGDDADDFMGKFFEKFNVGHGDFEFDRYFSGEGLNFFVIVWMIFSKRARRKYDKEPVTLGMLERAIEIGVWDSKRLCSPRGANEA
jgi:hypothetical protein